MNHCQTFLRKTIPPVYFLAALVLMMALSNYLPVLRLIYTPLRFFGGITILAGLFITSWGAWSFKKAGTPIKPFEKSTTLVTRDLFQYSRNPMYLGLLVMLFGSWIALGALSPLLVIPIFFFVIQEGFVKPEEEFLEKIFGEQYLVYKTRVRRWL
jgi:Putative protein-S-isoprenylcysteine methyltransferase